LVKVQPRVVTAKCEAHAVNSDVMSEGSGVAKSSRLRIET